MHVYLKDLRGERVSAVERQWEILKQSTGNRQLLDFAFQAQRPKNLSHHHNDYETLGTLLLKLVWDERDTIAGWGAGVKTRHQLYVDQQVAGTFKSQS